MKRLSRDKRARAPQRWTRANADSRRVPICNLVAFSVTGVNKDPRPNIDRVYVSRLHILSPALDAFEDRVEMGKKRKKGERGSKEKC